MHTTTPTPTSSGTGNKAGSPPRAIIMLQLLDTHAKRALLIITLSPLIITLLEHPTSSSSSSHWRHARGGPPMLKLSSNSSSSPQKRGPPPTRRTACVEEGGFYRGRWVHAPNTTRPHTHINLRPHAFTRGEVAFRAQYPLEEKGGGTQHLPWNEWDFTPHDSLCVLKAWNRTAACKVLDRAMQTSRRVLFIGDSMSFTHAVSFVLMLGGEMPSGNQGRRRTYSTHPPTHLSIHTHTHPTPIPTAAWKEQSLCGDILDKPIRVHFIRNDALYTSPIRLMSWDGKSPSPPTHPPTHLSINQNLLLLYPLHPPTHPPTHQTQACPQTG